MAVETVMVAVGSPGGRAVRPWACAEHGRRTARPAAAATLTAVARPAVDVVVPFLGSDSELHALDETLSRLKLGDGDSIVIVDNRPQGAAPSVDGPIPVVRAAAVQSPGYARNRGAERGHAEWLVFIDADTRPDPQLIERYFDPPPPERAGLLAGGILDEEVSPRGPAVPRWCYIRRNMSQDQTYRFGDWGFAQTANAACRRSAFEQIGGFRENIRAGEDADLTYRLREAGWIDQRRESAAVVHRSRQTLRGFVRQNLDHGAGGEWVHGRYPWAMPPRRRIGLAWWAVRWAVCGLAAAVLRRDRDRALRALLDPVDELAYELGRSLDNELPGAAASPRP